MTAGETKVVVRKLVCILHSAGEWFWKPRSPGCTPDLWSQPLWHGAQRAASLWKAPRWFQYMVKGGECQEGGLLAAWVNAESLRCEYLAWGDVMIWLPVRLMDYGSFSHVIMGSGSSLWAQILSACQCIEHLPWNTLSSTFELSNLALPTYEQIVGVSCEVKTGSILEGRVSLFSFWQSPIV